VETDCGILVDELKEIPESSRTCYLWWHGTGFKNFLQTLPVVSITNINKSANQVADELDRPGRKEVRRHETLACHALSHYCCTTEQGAPVSNCRCIAGWI
jgi:murein L,D-transpeptidase YcbB/YkuD